MDEVNKMNMDEVADGSRETYKSVSLCPSSCVRQAIPGFEGGDSTINGVSSQC